MTESRQQLDAYRTMVTIRRFEEMLLDLYADGHITGTVHTSIGQEACAVGVIDHLDPATDFVWSNHRGHGHYLAFTGDVYPLLAEILGRSDGLSGGVGGSQHVHADHFYTNGVLGGTVAAAVGTALAKKLSGEEGIVTVFLGDGAMGEGIVYEAFNMAALWEVPLLFVLEHNRYAQSTHWSLTHSGPLEDRVASFGISTTSVRDAVYPDVSEAAEIVVSKVRGGDSPQLLALHTYRLGPHSKGDDSRDADELQGHWARDPLARFRASLDADVAGIDAEVEAMLREMTERALAAPIAGAAP